jgi:hypothetical protein
MTEAADLWANLHEDNLGGDRAPPELSTRSRALHPAVAELSELYRIALARKNCIQAGPLAPVMSLST